MPKRNILGYPIREGIGTRRKHTHKKSGKREESKRVRNLDFLAEFDEFAHSMLPQLQKMVIQNWPPDKIRKAFAPLLQARMIQAGATGALDSSVTLSAAKDTLDRHEGTALQRTSNMSMYARMDRKELAALALQKLVDANLISEDVVGDLFPVKDVKSQVRNNGADGDDEES